jgi:cob(I)alamin adenosyltransferase
MVRLSSITTKTGDAGTSRLADGMELPKSHPIFAAAGAIDEANSALGVARSLGLPETISPEIAQIQNDLFDVGADIATPLGVSWEAKATRVQLQQIERLEDWTVAHGDHLAALSSFILPGGSQLAAAMHVARAVSRRAEREAVQAWEHLPGVEGRQNRHPLVYLNRLSDYLFQVCRRLNNDGQSDILWVPGGSPKTEE